MKVVDKIPVDFANWAADEFINYFKNYSCLEDYLRFIKKLVIADFEQSGESRASLTPHYSERCKIGNIFDFLKRVEFINSIIGNINSFFYFFI